MRKLPKSILPLLAALGALSSFSVHASGARDPYSFLGENAWDYLCETTDSPWEKIRLTDSGFDRLLGTSPDDYTPAQRKKLRFGIAKAKVGKYRGRILASTICFGNHYVGGTLPGGNRDDENAGWEFVRED